MPVENVVEEQEQNNQAPGMMMVMTFVGGRTDDVDYFNKDDAIINDIIYYCS